MNPQEILEQVQLSQNFLETQMALYNSSFKKTIRSDSKPISDHLP